MRTYKKTSNCVRALSLSLLVGLSACGETEKKAATSGGGGNGGRHFNCSDPFVGHYDVQATGTCKRSLGDVVLQTSGEIQIFCNGTVKDDIFVDRLGTTVRLGTPEEGTWRELDQNSLRFDENLSSQADWERISTDSENIESWFTLDEGEDDCDQGVVLRVLKR